MEGYRLFRAIGLCIRQFDDECYELMETPTLEYCNDCKSVRLDGEKQLAVDCFDEFP